MSDTRITISPKVSKEVYTQFRDLCHANGIPVERGIEETLRTALHRAGVLTVFSSRCNAHLETMYKVVSEPARFKQVP